jgi:hypothetical protein
MYSLPPILFHESGAHSSLSNGGDELILAPPPLRFIVFDVFDVFDVLFNASLLRQFGKSFLDTGYLFQLTLIDIAFRIMMKNKKRVLCVRN